MNEIFIYLLKVSLAISLVSIPYYFWLRQDAALNVKRIYMAGGIILSWLFPLLEIRKPGALSTFTQAYFIDPNTAAPAATPGITGTAGTAGGFTISIVSIILAVYLLGMLILFLRHAFMLRKLHRIDRKKDSSDHKIIYTNGKEIFTLFSKIFIPKDLKSSNGLDAILIHERAHLQQWHMIDLIIAETNLLFTWFNPFSWLISRMIKENHEHLADRSVLSKGVNPAHYKAQLLNHTVGVELFSLGMQFNHSLTKKRFQMMKKIKSPKKGFIKYLALIPAIIIALGLFTAASAQQKAIHGKVVFEDGSPAPGSSIVVVGSTQGCVSDLDGTFNLDVEGNPELVVSFVGFKSVRIFANELKKKDVVLHPKAFKMDLSDVVAADPKSKKTESKAEKSTDQVKKESNPNPEIFYVVEEMPSFPGGKEQLKGYIYKNLVYPEKAKKKGMTGKVYVQFTVGITGALNDIEVIKTSDDIFNEAAMNVFRGMPNWKPGKQRSKAVRAKVIVPVLFNTDQE